MHGKPFRPAEPFASFFQGERIRLQNPGERLQNQLDLQFTQMLAAMTSQEIETLVGAVETRNKKHYDWIRSLVLLASGALAVVVSLHSDKQLAVMPLFYMKAAWVSLGLGILLGSVSLHGDVWTSAETAQRLARALSEPHPRNITVHVKLPFRYRASTSLCYLSLSCAVISFVLYALTR
ncbi:MAG TPA: hypothetical protein VFW05_13900 [Verrucomicrobiae bacterium]|nr:hypothetical protein [Verrucomicrobiae bacterium]